MSGFLTVLVLSEYVPSLPISTDVTTMSKGKLQNILNRLKDLAKSEDCQQEPVKTKCRQLEDEYLKFDLQQELAKIPDLTDAIRKVGRRAC